MTGPWWWWPHGRAPGERAVLFFPPAGSDQTIALPLVPLVGGLGLGVLRLPGRGPRQAEAAPMQLTSLAAAISDSILALGGPPPVLVGHSFGGLLAYAVACRVEEGGGTVARLVAVASASPPSWQRQVVSSAPTFVAMRTDEILGRGGLPAHIAGDPELAGHARRIIATDVGLMQCSYPLERLRCPLTVMRGDNDQLVDAVALAEWAAVTSANVDNVTVPGGHFFYRARPELLVTRLRMELSTIDGAYEHR